MCVFGVWSSGNQPDGPSDSDSDSEEQVDFRINDWLIFHMDRNVSARTTLLVQLCPQGSVFWGALQQDMSCTTSQQISAFVPVPQESCGKLSGPLPSPLSCVCVCVVARLLSWCIK